LYGIKSNTEEYLDILKIKSHSLGLKKQALENTGHFCNSFWRCSNLLILWITCSLLFPERLKQFAKGLPKSTQQMLQVTNWKMWKKEKGRNNRQQFSGTSEASTHPQYSWGCVEDKAPSHKTVKMSNRLFPLCCDINVHCCLHHGRCWPALSGYCLTGRYVWWHSPARRGTFTLQQKISNANLQMWPWW